MIGDVLQFVDGVGSLVKGGVKLGGKIAKGAKAVKELEKGARLTELAKTFVTGAKDTSELNSAASKAAKVAKLRIVREAEEAKKVEKAASAAEKFRSELDVLKQRAREIPRTLTDDEIRACEAVKLQMKGKLPEPGKVSVAEVEKIDEAVMAANASGKTESAAKTEFVAKFVDKNERESLIKNIEDFINGNKSFDDVLDQYVRLYADNVNSNKPWSWEDSILGGENLTQKQKSLIKQHAIDDGLIPKVVVNKFEDMRYGFADFEAVGVVKETKYLPEKLWKVSDVEQFKWLDEQIGGTVVGYTWHHTEIPGKMQLVPTGIHNITTHNGGRTTGMWADAPR